MKLFKRRTGGMAHVEVVSERSEDKRVYERAYNVLLLRVTFSTSRRPLVATF